MPNANKWQKCNAAYALKNSNIKKENFAKEKKLNFLLHYNKISF